MKYYLISGEASGDLHGSNLIKELRLLDPQAEVRAWGGNMMRDAGAELVKHYRDLAFMGFVEVLKNLPTIISNIRFCKNDIIAYHPDVLILIDYPGFNLRIAEWAKQHGFKVVYYISPQVWAWKESRVKKMKRNIDRLLCILPFEKDYYRKRWAWEVDYVGHPLVEVVEKESGNATDLFHHHKKKIIALLPGSRKQEISVKLPIMLSAAAAFPDYYFVVAEAPGQDPSFYQPFLLGYPNVGTVRSQTYSLLANATAALVTSGTATLETALFGVPEVVCYKGSTLSYQIAKRLIKIKYISLVNLIMDREVVTELIQDELTTSNLISELRALLEDDTKKAALKNDYAALKALLRSGGNASHTAAAIIHNMIV